MIIDDLRHLNKLNPIPQIEAIVQFHLKLVW